MTDTTTYDQAAAERGMKLLSKRDRDRLHPRAQVQSLRRIAVRATSKVDHLVKLGQQSPEWAATPEELSKLRGKATDATEAMVKLNVDHKLGY